MKKLLITSITALTLCSVSSFTAPKAHAADIAQSLCEYIAADDKKRMRSFLKSNKVKIRNVFDDITCNGKNLLAFAAERGAVETGSLMIGQLPKSVVTDNLALIAGSAQLTTVANERVNS